MDKLRERGGGRGQAQPPCCTPRQVTVYPKAVHGPARHVQMGRAGVLPVRLLPAALAALGPRAGAGVAGGAARPAEPALLLLQSRVLAAGHLLPRPALLILSAVGLFLVTSLAGRVWCGYACPQTVWTDLFMWIERLVEGDRNARMRRDQGPAHLRQGLAQGGQAHDLARHRLLDRRRLDHVFRRCADADRAVLDRRGRAPRPISSSSCSPPPPICWPAGRASRSAPTCAPGRASRPRCSTSRA